MNGSGERARFWSSEATDKEASSKDLGTSMSAISLGFVATAILISMFLIMAIFEHLRRSRTAYALQSAADGGGGSRASGNQQQAQLHWLRKFHTSQSVVTWNTSELSVLMPGQQYPTYLAQPAPLPCPREGAIKRKFMYQENAMYDPKCCIVE